MGGVWGFMRNWILLCFVVVVGCVDAGSMVRSAGEVRMEPTLAGYFHEWTVVNDTDEHIERVGLLLQARATEGQWVTARVQWGRDYLKSNVEPFGDARVGWEPDEWDYDTAYRLRPGDYRAALIDENGDPVTYEEFSVPGFDRETVEVLEALKPEFAQCGVDAFPHRWATDAVLVERLLGMGMAEWRESNADVLGQVMSRGTMDRELLAVIDGATRANLVEFAGYEHYATESVRRRLFERLMEPIASEQEVPEGTLVALAELDEFFDDQSRGDVRRFCEQHGGGERIGPHGYRIEPRTNRDACAQLDWVFGLVGYFGCGGVGFSFSRESEHCDAVRAIWHDALDGIFSQIE